MNDIYFIHIKKRDKFVIIDLDDRDFVLGSAKNWHETGSGYCSGWVKGKKTPTLLHRLLCPPMPGLEVDHINRFKFDNRRSNLRQATKSLNNNNTRKRRNTSSRFRGVCWDKLHGKWVVHVGKKHVGIFTNEEEAARAYNEAALKTFGPSAFQNVL